MPHYARKRGNVVLLCAAAAAAAAAASALALPALAARSATDRPSASAAALFAEYSALSAPATSADTIPGPTDSSITVDRALGTTIPMWIAESGDQLCVFLDAASQGGPELSQTAPSVCAPSASLIKNGGALFGGFSASASGAKLSAAAAEALAEREATAPTAVLYGVLPDGVSTVVAHFADGVSSSYPVHDNGVAFTTANRSVSSLSWTTPAGGQNAVTIGG